MIIRAVRSFEELDDLRPDWERWQTHTNQDLDQFELVCGLRPEIEGPFVTVIERDGQPHAMLLGRLEHSVIAPSIGYLTPLRLPARMIVVIHRGVLGQVDLETARHMVAYLVSMLREGVADAVSFHHVSEHSPLLQALQMDRSTSLSEKRPRWSTHREMTLAADSSFMSDKLRSKHRSRFRNRMRQLEAAFPGRLAWHWLSEFDDVDGLCRRLEHVAAKTYQRGLGVGFVDNEEYRRRFALQACRGQLRVVLLEIDGEPRAFWFGSVYGHVFHASDTGYDPALREYQVGTLLLVQMIEALTSEGVRRIDFGIGDAIYKERFCDRSWRETPVWLFAPTLKGLVLMLWLKFALALDGAARQVLQRTGLIDRIKTLWRRHRIRAEDAAPAAPGQG